MRTVGIVAVMVLAVLLTAGVAYAQFPGEPKEPPAYDPVASMKYTFQICAPDPAVLEAQTALKEQGYYAGPIDGVISPEVKDAVWRFQRAKGLNTTASLDRFTMLELGVDDTPVYASPPSFEEGARMRAAPAPVDVQTP